MKNEQIKEITSKAIEQLIAALNEGEGDFGGPARIRTWDQRIMSPLL